MPRHHWLSLLFAVLCFPLTATGRAEEAVGPFPSWTNVKTAYQAVGDGKADDTAALQKALDELGTANHSATLLLPAGTYRITRGLTMTSQMNVNVFGAGASQTVLRWDGSADGVMLRCNGVRYSRFGRLTWDGAGRAATAVAHQWDGHTPNADTHNEHSDEVFQDVGWGIRAGLPHFMDAECAVLRCRFNRCSQAGVSIESFNALDWFIRDCLFDHCKVGVTNDPGAGNFHVYDSTFIESAEADVKVYNTMYFSLRGNTSVGSRAFYKAGGIGAGAQQTLQGNTILNPRGTAAIQVGNLGPLILLDNRIQTAQAPAVVVNDAAPYLSLGNTFTVAGPIQGKRPIAGLDNATAATPAVRFHLPDWPAGPGWSGPAASIKRITTEIAVGSGADVLQRAINAAAKLPGKRPILHLPPGDYPIDKVLIIPAGCDVQIVGDGYATVLRWKGASTGPVLRLAGPSRATLRDLTVDGAGTAEGIRLDQCDQPGDRFFAEQGEVQDCKSVGLLADRTVHAHVQLQDFYHSECGVGVKAIGGKIGLFGGASSNNQLSYDVQSGGQIVAEDIWYEGAPPRFVHLTGAGAFTLNGAVVAPGRPGPNEAAQDPDFAAVEADDFHGDLALLGVQIQTRVSVHGAGHDTDFLALGVQGNGTDYYANTSPHAHAALVGSLRSTDGGGATTIPDVGTADSAFLRRMLAPVRQTVAEPLTDFNTGRADVRLFRVCVQNATVGIHLSP